MVVVAVVVHMELLVLVVAAERLAVLVRTT
jgi:hypothetical protein